MKTYTLAHNLKLIDVAPPMPGFKKFISVYVLKAEKVALMSITEGEDKPLKYPLVFSLANLLVLTKMDLLPYLRFDLDLCRQNAWRVNPGLPIIATSVYSQTGMEVWFDYLRARVRGW